MILPKVFFIYLQKTGKRDNKHAKFTLNSTRKKFHNLSNCKQEINVEIDKIKRLHI